MRLEERDYEAGRLRGLHLWKLEPSIAFPCACAISGADACAVAAEACGGTTA